MKLAHLADLHLGFRQFDRLTPRGTNQREADVADAFRRAVDDLLAQQPDLIVIAGDVFHSVRPTNPAILHLFQQLQRVRVGLPDTPVVMIAGNHDTPRSSETGTILRLYEALGVEVVVDGARRLVFPKLDCAVLAVPHQALAQPERPALRPERGAAINILLLHGEVEGVIGTDPTIAEYGGAVLSRADLGAAQWDYVALGHYHVAHEVAANVWYPGALEYVSTNPWGELRDEAHARRPGKGYLLVDLPGARVSFRPVAPARRFVDLPALDARGLGPKEIDARIAERVAAAKPPIDDQVVRLVVQDVARATARDLDHAAVRGYKARALNFLLDLRRPAEQRTVAVGGPGKRHTLPEVVRGFLERRLLDAELPREEFVRLGVEYVERAGAAAEERG
jgi:exonuclease SbcD